jgi:GntR family transcriptional regulator
MKKPPLRWLIASLESGNMQDRVPVRGTQLATQIVDILLERMSTGVYPPESRLPSENELVAQFNVSRTTVRSALGVLAGRGLVIRRHGVGTFVSQLSRISNPMNEAVDFNYLIASHGFEPSVQFINVELVKPDIELARALAIEPDQQVLQSIKIFLADNEPKVYVVNDMPAWLFDESLIQEVLVHPEITEPIYDFLEERCKQRVEYHITTIRADNAENCEILDLPLDPNTPTIVMKEVAYNADETPLWHSIEYFPGNTMSFELIRRRSSSGY